MIILAIDLGKFNSMICVYDSDTQKHEFLRANTTRDYLQTVLKHHPADLVVMEACSCSGWVSDRVDGTARAITVGARGDSPGSRSHHRMKDRSACRMTSVITESGRLIFPSKCTFKPDFGASQLLCHGL